jgi:hypothetical protein
MRSAWRVIAVVTVMIGRGVSLRLVSSLHSISSPILAIEVP